jgi:hypothetical protein
MCFAFSNKRDPFVELKLLLSNCFSFYGSALWDLSNPGIEKFCCTWRKGLRRALSLTVDALCDILPGLAGILPVFNEIVIRSASFIQKCLSSDSHIVRSVANIAVFSLRMRSPLGRNAFVCCSRYDLTLSNIFMLNRERVIRYVGRRMGVDGGARLSLVRELLLIRSGILSLSDLAFSNIDVDLMIDSLSRSA